MMRHERGFTVVEVVVAVMVLSVGLLGLVTSAALVTRMIGRGQRSSVAASYAQRRLDMLRSAGCYSDTVRTSTGPEVLMRGSTAVDTVRWNFTALTPATAKAYRIVVTTKYPTARGKWRTDTLETEISCLF